MNRLRTLYLLVVLLASTLAASVADGQQVQPGATPPVNAFVYIVTDDKATALYHKMDCAWAKNATVRGYSEEEAKKRYFQPHCLCITGKEAMPPCTAPSTVPSTATTTTTAPPTVPTAAVPAPTPAAPPVTSAPKSPTVTTARQQCAATTQRRTRCSRLAEIGSAYCWQHK